MATDVFTVRLRDIPEEGLDLSVELPGDVVAQAVEGIEGGEPAASNASVSVHLHRERDNVFLRGALTGTLVVGCVRCLEPAKIAANSPLSMTFLPADEKRRGTGKTGHAPHAARGEIEESDIAEDQDGDDEVSEYRGDTIELGELLREQLVLSIPFAPLCRPDCKGLCPQCGVDRNSTTCSCVEETPEHPFAGVGKLGNKLSKRTAS